MNHDNGISNQSANRPFEDVLKASLSRRHVLARSAALSATGFLAALAGNKSSGSGGRCGNHWPALARPPRCRCRNSSSPGPAVWSTFDAVFPHLPPRGLYPAFRPTISTTC
jgi:hypothetical protein